jgi:hypothetical protein
VSYEERISDEQLDHLIRMQDMLRSRMAGVLASDDGFHEGNVHAGTYRALVELKRLRRELAEARELLRSAAADLRLAAKCMNPAAPVFRQLNATANRIDAAMAEPKVEERDRLRRELAEAREDAGNKLYELAGYLTTVIPELASVECGGIVGHVDEFIRIDAALAEPKP